jgi:hypothetical protein
MARDLRRRRYTSKTERSTNLNPEVAFGATSGLGTLQTRRGGDGVTLERDPEKCVAIFPRDKREAFARRSCSNKELYRDDDSEKNHLALGNRAIPALVDFAHFRKVK